MGKFKGVVNMEMTLSDVQTWLNANAKEPAVTEFLKGLGSQDSGLNAESVAAYLDTQEGQHVLQPFVDRRVDGAIKTYKEGHYAQELKSAVAAEILKLNPQETPEQRANRELREQVESMQKENKQDKLKRLIVEEASKMSVPAFFIDDYLPGSLEEGKLYLTKCKQFVDDEKLKAVNDVVATYKNKPSPKGEGDADPSKMSPNERMMYETRQAEKRLGIPSAEE